MWPITRCHTGTEQKAQFVELEERCALLEKGTRGCFAVFAPEYQMQVVFCGTLCYDTVE